MCSSGVLKPTVTTDAGSAHAVGVSFRKEPDLPGSRIAVVDGRIGTPGIGSRHIGRPGLSVLMCHENNGKELRGDQSSKRHATQEIFHGPPPYAVNSTSLASPLHSRCDGDHKTTVLRAATRDVCPGKRAAGTTHVNAVAALELLQSADHIVRQN
jgi:hypothetical protein